MTRLRARCGGGLAAALLCPMLAAAQPGGPAPAPAAAAAPAVWVQVVSHGWHTGLVLPLAEIGVDGWPVRAAFASASHVEIGWGDRDFYRAADPGVWLGLKAAVSGAPGVLHVVGLATDPALAFAGQRRVALAVPASGWPRLIERLRASHEWDAAGRAIDLGPGLYGDSRFFASRERFHLLKTCNVWVAELLQAAGLPVNPALAITADGLMAQLQVLATPRPTRSEAAETAPPRRPTP